LTTPDAGNYTKEVEEGESVFAKIGANFAKKDLSLDGSGDTGGENGDGECCGDNPNGPKASFYGSDVK